MNDQPIMPTANKDWAGAPEAPGETKLSLAEWLLERTENCTRFALKAEGADRRGWLEDQKFLAQALAAVVRDGERDTAIRDAVAAEREANCAVMCSDCRDGTPLKDGTLMHLLESKYGDHPTACRAVAIHARGDTP